MGGRRGRVFRNMYKGHMDKTKGGRIKGCLLYTSDAADEHRDV